MHGLEPGGLSLLSDAAPAEFVATWGDSAGLLKLPPPGF